MVLILSLAIAIIALHIRPCAYRKKLNHIFIPCYTSAIHHAGCYPRDGPVIHRGSITRRLSARDSLLLIGSPRVLNGVMIICSLSKFGHRLERCRALRTNVVENTPKILGLQGFWPAERQGNQELGGTQAAW
jgi:hypothetical protein